MVLSTKSFHNITLRKLILQILNPKKKSRIVKEIVILIIKLLLLISISDEILNCRQNRYKRLKYDFIISILRSL